MIVKNYFFNNYNIKYYAVYSIFIIFSLFKGNNRLKKN